MDTADLCPPVSKSPGNAFVLHFCTSILQNRLCAYSLGGVAFRSSGETPRWRARARTHARSLAHTHTHAEVSTEDGSRLLPPVPA